MTKLILSLVLVSFLLPVNAGFKNLQPREVQAFKIQDSQVGAKCSYTISIKTSCSSVSYTRDKISFVVGDDYGNEVYVPRLDDPSSGTFERCSTDTFQISGPCLRRICYQYLLRRGNDGWIPQWVKISVLNYRPVTFNYNRPLPNGVWFGFDLCSGRSHDMKDQNVLISQI